MLYELGIIVIEDNENFIIIEEILENGVKRLTNNRIEDIVTIEIFDLERNLVSYENMNMQGFMKTAEMIPSISDIDNEQYFSSLTSQSRSAVGGFAYYVSTTSHNATPSNLFWRVTIPNTGGWFISLVGLRSTFRNQSSLESFRTAVNNMDAAHNNMIILLTLGVVSTAVSFVLTGGLASALFMVGSSGPAATQVMNLYNATNDARFHFWMLFPN